MTKGQKEDQRLNGGNDKSPVGVKFSDFFMQGMNHQSANAHNVRRLEDSQHCITHKGRADYPGVFPGKPPDFLLPGERSDETQPDPTGSPSSGLPGLLPGASSGTPPGTSPGAASGWEAGAESDPESGEDAGAPSLKDSVKGTSDPTAQPLSPALKTHKRRPDKQTTDNADSNRQSFMPASHVPLWSH